MVADSIADVPLADADLEAETALLHYARHPLLDKDLLHSMRAKRLIDFSPGVGGLMLAAMHLRIMTVCICKNSAHMTYLRRVALEHLEKAIQDPSDARFYRSTAALGLPAEEKEGQEKEGQETVTQKRGKKRKGKASSSSDGGSSASSNK